MVKTNAKLLNKYLFSKPSSKGHVIGLHSIYTNTKPFIFCLGVYFCELDKCVFNNCSAARYEALGLIRCRGPGFNPRVHKHVYWKFYLFYAWPHQLKPLGKFWSVPSPCTLPSWSEKLLGADGASHKFSRTWYINRLSVLYLCKLGKSSWGSMFRKISLT